MCNPLGAFLQKFKTTSEGLSRPLDEFICTLILPNQSFRPHTSVQQKLSLLFPVCGLILCNYEISLRYPLNEIWLYVSRYMRIRYSNTLSVEYIECVQLDERIFIQENVKIYMNIQEENFMLFISKRTYIKMWAPLLIRYKEFLTHHQQTNKRQYNRCNQRNALQNLFCVQRENEQEAINNGDNDIYLFKFIFVMAVFSV